MACFPGPNKCFSSKIFGIIPGPTKDAVYIAKYGQPVTFIDCTKGVRGRDRSMTKTMKYSQNISRDLCAFIIGYAQENRILQTGIYPCHNVLFRVSVVKLHRSSNF